MWPLQAENQSFVHLIQIFQNSVGYNTILNKNDGLIAKPWIDHIVIYGPKGVGNANAKTPIIFSGQFLSYVLY